MPPFLPLPQHGDNVQAWASDDPQDGDLTYVRVTYLACVQAPPVNPKTGKVLGAADEKALYAIHIAGPRSYRAVPFLRCFERDGAGLCPEIGCQRGFVKSRQRSARTEPRSTPHRSAPEQQATNREVRDKQGWSDEGSGVAHLQPASVGECGRSR
jgi:hypothetical protein